MKKTDLPVEGWEEQYWELWAKDSDLTHLDDDILKFIRTLLVQEYKRGVQDQKKKDRGIWGKRYNEGYLQGREDQESEDRTGVAN